MATSKFLRIFFGKFFSIGQPYVIAPFDDKEFADFSLGIDAGGGKYLHTRVPQNASGAVTGFDEYLDLYTGKINPVRPEDVTLYKDLAGIEYMQQWTTSSQFALVPTNSVSIESELLEWCKPTRRLSIPLVADPMPPIISPNPNGSHTLPAPGTIAWFNVDDPNARVMRFYFRFARDLGGGNFLYSDPTIVDAPYNSTAVPTDTAWAVANPNADNLYLVAYRALLTRNYVGATVVSDFPYLITDWNPAGADSPLIIANSGYQYRKLNGLFNQAVTGTLLDRPALNDARARMNFDYERRARIDTGTGLPTQLMLILNTENYKYYKGIALSVSPFFSTGVGKRTEDAAIVQLQVFEEGRFTEATLTNPTVGLEPQLRKTTLPT